jgi:Na+-driven multidrug efflux pump
LDEFSDGPVPVLEIENEAHSNNKDDLKLFIVCLYSSFLDQTSKYAMTLIGFFLPLAEQYTVILLILTTGVILTTISSTIASVAKSLMSKEIDLANPKLAKRIAVVSLSLTILIQLVISAYVRANSGDSIQKFTTEELADVRANFISLIYVFTFMMLLETVNSHLAVMLLSLGMHKRELIMRTIILVIIQVPVAFLMLGISNFGLRGLFYA